MVKVRGQNSNRNTVKQTAKNGQKMSGDKDAAGVTSFLSANGRSKGKEEERKGRERARKKKGKGGKEIGSEALAETEKIANAPAGNRTLDPSKRG